jgi:predicted amidohydrolase
MAGLVEIEDDRFYNCYVTVGPEGYIVKHRKLHPFIHRDLTAGGNYTVVELVGCKVGFLTCYDNNLVENVRLTTLLGAEIIIAPHVTGCLPSEMPGRGTVDRRLWDNRLRDPVSLRLDFDGPKGRGWLLRWLPARAYENGVYYVFSNVIGWDHDTVKPGLAMILDPYGEILVESRALGDDVVVALLTNDKIKSSPGKRYLRARRPELYAKLVEPQASVTSPGWNVKSAAPAIPQQQGT